MRPSFLFAISVLWCAPLVGQGSKKGCPDLPADSIPAGQRIYVACQVDREAKPRGAALRLDFTPPAGGLRDGSCYRAEYEFVVDTLGFADLGTVREVSSNSADFGQALRDAIPRLRYDPARRADTLVRQLVTYKQMAGVRVVSSAFGTAPRARPPRC